MGKPLLDALSKRLLSQVAGLSRRSCALRPGLDKTTARRQLHCTSTSTSTSRPLIPTGRGSHLSAICRSPQKSQVFRSVTEAPSTARWFGKSSMRKTAAAKVADAPTTTQEAAEAKRKFFPEHSDKIVAYWLLGSAVSVFGIVVFGGLTRLTESGLSITEWKPVTGSIPPMNEEDWESEFALYRASPEFQLLNRNMTLPEFKEIYFMEWTHRLWGRFIGVTFAIPAVYFIARRRVSARTAARLIGITGLIGFQGFIGWWMVKSGLKDDLFAPGSHPRVSQYRLTAHLGTAIVTYAAMLMAGLRILRARQVQSMSLKNAQDLFTMLHTPGANRLRKVTTGMVGLIFTTALSGALVAGLDAGLIYNEFPYMGTGLAPPMPELFDRFYVRSEPGETTQFELIWRNMLENPSLVQLDHRILAMTTFTAIIGVWYWTRKSAALKAVMVPSVRKRVVSVVHMACVQVALGLSTLLYLVPTPVAAAHQAGALALLTCAFALRSHLAIPRNLAKTIAAKSRGAVPHAGIRAPGPASKVSVNSASKEV